jgi:hypothetical protein
VAPSAAHAPPPEGRGRIVGRTVHVVPEGWAVQRLCHPPNSELLVFDVCSTYSTVIETMCSLIHIPKAFPMPAIDTHPPASDARSRANSRDIGKLTRQVASDSQYGASEP